MLTNQENFDAVNDVLRDGNKVFIVPFFQRPYAWDDLQIQQLLDDIDTGSRRQPEPIHYLSPVHVVQIKSPSQKEWCNYVDQANDDIIALNQSNFTCDDESAIRVFLVIDGQQRLTTLFSLFWQMSTAGLTFSCGGRTIPRLILCPTHDHYRFRELLQLPTQAPSVASKAQNRIAHCFTKSIPATYKQFVMSTGFQLLLVSLSVNYGLQAFQTTNDRGKNLTILEKLKSLTMEYDLNNVCNLLANIHLAFGNAYQVLDAPGCCCDESEFIQALSIMLRIPNPNDTDALWQGSEMAYEKYFSTVVKSPTAINLLLSLWVDTARNIAEQMKRIDQRRFGGYTGASCIMPTRSTRTVADDYSIILDSLGLNIRCLSTLFKFGELFHKNDWQDKVATITPQNSTIADYLQKKLQQIKGAIEGDIPEFISHIIDSLKEQIELLRNPAEKMMSPLEVVERIQLFTLEMGSDYPGGFKNYWNTAFKLGNSVSDAVITWYEFASAHWGDNRSKFICNLCEPYAKESILKYLLREYEFSTHGNNIHFNKSLQVEHIFPQTPTVKPPSGYFASTITAFDYDGLISKLGNQIFLDGSLNSSIKHTLPSAKAGSYATQSHNGIVVPLPNQVASAITIGNEFNRINNPRHYQTYLDLREIELAIFATERFF